MHDEINNNKSHEFRNRNWQFNIKFDLINEQAIHKIQHRIQFTIIGKNKSDNIELNMDSAKLVSIKSA